jgi:competence protein ComEA
MKVRVAVLAVVVVSIGLALWRPAREIPLQAAQEGATALPSAFASGNAFGRHRRRGRRAGSQDAGSDSSDAVVYVVGAVHRPGLYHLRVGARIADAVAAAGGLTAAADPAGINLAAHLADGDEIDAPATARRTASKHRSRRRAPPTPNGSIDPNTASASELAAVPGIGRSIAARIVEMRERDGPFTSLDELLDVAGLTQSKLERALPFLQSP